jgi:beta-lactamase class A
MPSQPKNSRSSPESISEITKPLQREWLDFLLKNRKQFAISGSIALAFAFIGHQLTSGKAPTGQPKEQTTANQLGNANIPNMPPTMPVDAITLAPLPVPANGTENVLITPDLDLSGGNITLDHKAIKPSIVTNHQPSVVPSAGSPNLQGIHQAIQRAFNEEKLSFNAQNVSFFFQDLKSGQTIGQSEQTLRYPASMVKPFWMAILYDQITKQGSSAQFSSLRSANRLMIKRSDNNAASVIIDALTGTSSEDNSSNSEELAIWVARRSVLTNFFRSRGRYSQSIRIGQKVFPITKPKLIERPQKNELKLRLMQGKTPIRNAISVLDAVNVIVELYQGGFTNNNLQMQQEVQEALHIPLSDRQQLRRATGLAYFNPVRSFFSEDLPSTAQYYGKSGWTSDTRNEVALIMDGNHQYILAVFTDGTSYARNEKLFPKIGRYVHSVVLNQTR